MTEPAAQRLVVGTRGSKLARAQTGWVISQLEQANPGLQVEMRIISTAGDRDQIRPLPEIGGKGLFTEELERALLDGDIDLAVHSTKDLPTGLKAGLAVLAYPPREDARDAWIGRGGVRFQDLPQGAVVGTTSLRRQSQLLRARPDLTFVGLRGNVDTRINKVQRGDCDGAVLAMAGLKRCGLEHEATHPIDMELMLPAPAQGVLALEGRADDARVQAVVRSVHHADTAAAVECERTVLGQLDAGCRAPGAVYAEVISGRLQCRAVVLSPTGTHTVEARGELAVGDWPQLAARLVDQLKAAGAEAIIAECRS